MCPEKKIGIRIKEIFITKKQLIIYMLLAMAFLTVLPAFAEPVNIASPVIGSWMLDSVYENASGPDRYVLDPENAGSLYAESGNIYAFLAGGIAEMTMEGYTQYGYWEKQDDGFRMVINSSVRYSDKRIQTVPDIDPPYEMEFFYDEEQNLIHRYWKDDSHNASYHDLDFAYKPVPQGMWRLTKVFSRESGKEPVLLDPETSQSIYAESVNCFELYRSDVINIVPSETGYISEKGILKRSGDSWLLEYDDGYTSVLDYDDGEGVLHRYWQDQAADAVYLDLDFVYEKVPVWSWRLNYIYKTAAGAEPGLLDPETEPDLYQETAYTYIFAPDGTASALIPHEVYEGGEWSKNGDEILFRFGDGRDMTFVYDVKADVLHRCPPADSPDQESYDFVYLKE